MKGLWSANGKKKKEVVIIYKLELHTYRVMYAYIFHLWYSGRRPSSKLLEDDWHCKCLFLRHPTLHPTPPLLPSRFLKFSHTLTAVYFPPCSPISRLLLPLYTPLLQFKLKTGIMRKVMGRRQRRGKSEGVAWQSSVLVRVRCKTVLEKLQAHTLGSNAGTAAAVQVAQNMGALTG